MAKPAGSRDWGAGQNLPGLRLEAGAMRKIARRIVRSIINFDKILALGKEYKRLMERVKHLQARHQIDQVSDAPEAHEIAAELKLIQGRIKEILNELTF